MNDRLRPWPLPDPTRLLKPGNVIMHTRQYNKLCDAGLIRVRTATGREPELLWNGVPVFRDDNMPPSGWFIVPGGASETVETVILQKAQPQQDDEE